MRKYSIVALIVALMMIVSACSTSAGLLLKEATLKQMELKSFEGKSTLAVNIDTASMSNAFNVAMDTKQVDLLNSAVDLHVGADLLALAGIEVEPAKDGKVTLSIISKDGDSIISSPEDDIGIELSSFEQAMEEGFGEGKEEEFEQFIVTLQDTFRELMKQYLKDYNYSLRQIEDHGNVTVSLPNGESVETKHIEVQLNALDAIEMLEYSLNYFLENEEFQATFYDSIENLPTMLVDLADEEDDEDEEEIEEDFATVKEEINSAIKDFVKDLESVKTEFAEYENVIKDFATVSLHSYIGVNDKETYQTEFMLKVSYTEEMADLEIEELEDLSINPGDSITISSKDQVWNHNKEVSPIELPSKLITMEELMELDGVDEFKEIVGEHTLLAQLADQIMPLFDTGGFVDFYIDENIAYTMDGEVDVHLYTKNGQLMVPLKFLSEEMGAEVTWLKDTRQIMVEGNDHVLDVNVGKNKSVAFDGKKSADLKVEVVKGTSYINVRPFAEAMDWDLMWDAETKSVFIY